MTDSKKTSCAIAQPDWRGLGCRTARLVARAGPVGPAIWRLRAPRRSREDWTIEAAHCPYLGRHPYNLGDDAWRISIQEPHPVIGKPVEVAHLIATSEDEAFRSVAWLDAVATALSGSSDHPNKEPQP